MLKKRPITPVNSPKKIHHQPHKFKPLQVRLQALLDLYGLTVKEAAELTGFSQFTLLSWLSPVNSSHYRMLSDKRFDAFQHTLHHTMQKKRRKV